MTLPRFRRKVKYTPWPSARLFHASTARFKGFSGPVGSGKTVALAQEALKLAYLNRGCMGVLGAPTYRMLHDVTKLAFYDVLLANNIPHKPRESDNEVIILEPQHTVRFRSLNEPHRLVGPNLSWFGCDELSYCEEDSWRRLEARLRDPKAKLLCGYGGWTPNGLNWAWERFISEDKRPGYEAIIAKPFENRAVLDKTPDYYDRLKASYDERFYQQEVLGQYLEVFSGTVYWAYSEDNRRPLRYDRRYPICWTLDFNIEPLCSVICQIIPIGNTSVLHVIEEIALPNARTSDACEEFVSRVREWAPPFSRTPVSVYGDPAGTQRRTSATKTDWETVKEFLHRYPEFEVTWKVGRAAPLVKDRVNVVNGLLCNAEGHRRVFVDPKCKETIADFRRVTWKADAQGNLAATLAVGDPKRTHLSDALGYLIWTEFAPKAKAGMMAQYAF